MTKSPPGTPTEEPPQRKRRKKRARPSRYIRERWQQFIAVDDRGMMTIDGIPVDAITAKFGTPLYVMVESEIRRRLRRFKKVFPEHIRLQYAVKCNSNLEILRTVREHGFELDCSSVGELILGLLADFKPRQLSFTNLYKTEQDIHFAAKIGVQSITADSFEDIAGIALTAKKLKKHIDTVIRVNPMLQIGSYSTRGNKYGIPIGHVMRAVETARKAPYVDFTGFHFMGGYVYKSRVFKSAARAFAKLIRDCEDRGIRVKTVSLGGGFPAAIGTQTAFPIEEMRDFPAYWERLLRRHRIQNPPRLIFEPGKSIVLNAGIGLVRVISKKRLGRKDRVVVVDGSTYNFVPDALVQTDIQYDALPASKMNAPRVHIVTVAGNTCDCWDLLVRKIGMPKLRTGDIVAIMDVGAYAQVLANNFNTIKRAAVVMLKEDGTLKVIRRRDRYSEMFAPELDVLKMAGPDELEKYHNLYRVNVDKIWRSGGMGKLEKKVRKVSGNGNGNGQKVSKGVAAFRAIEREAGV